MDQLIDKNPVEHQSGSNCLKLESLSSSESYGLGLIQDYSSSSEDEGSEGKTNLSDDKTPKAVENHSPASLGTNKNLMYPSPALPSHPERLDLQKAGLGPSPNSDISLPHNKEFQANAEDVPLPDSVHGSEFSTSVDSVVRSDQLTHATIHETIQHNAWVIDSEDNDNKEMLGTYRSHVAGSEGIASDTDSEFDFPDPVADDRPLPPPKTKGELDLKDLPPIENLHISIPETACIQMGKIASIVSELVVVQSEKNLPALDIDTVLFLDKGKNSLGKVFDVMGQVSEPLYAVRFNTCEEITEKSIIVGMPVYYAPSTGFTSFVFFEQLRRLKGSDASWLDNNEPPEQYLEYSDDEQERRAKQALKAKRDGSNATHNTEPKTRKRKPRQKQSHYYSQQTSSESHADQLANIYWHNAINNSNVHNNNSPSPVFGDNSASNYYSHQNLAPPSYFAGSAPTGYYNYPNTSWNTNNPYFQYPFQQPYPPMFGCPPYPQLTGSSQQVSSVGSATEALEAPNLSSTPFVPPEGNIHDNKPG